MLEPFLLRLLCILHFSTQLSVSDVQQQHRTPGRAEQQLTWRACVHIFHHRKPVAGAGAGAGADAGSARQLPKNQLDSPQTLGLE